ncbi:MAG: aspartate carbamoyltransferase [Candidatus Micrarchaeia archaeon]|jgi:aspartate carbamoyltransferase catalytic subunit
MADYWTGKDILSSRDVSKEAIEQIWSKAKKYEDAVEKKKTYNRLSGKVLASLFFEPSTRTQFSFQTAMQRLGGSLIAFSDKDTTSVAKGETLYDTIKMVESCADVIVIRHSLEGAAKLAADAAQIPVINGGDGANQHPTQALLDTYTIFQQKGKIDGQTITLIGDLKNGRTIHSLCYALSNFDCTIELWSPPQLKIPQAIVNDISEKVKVVELESLDFSDSDVVYATRIQKERFDDPEEAKRYSYVIDAEMVRSMKDDAIIMHPFPRVDEIATEVDQMPQAKYFQQEANGIPVRMAILESVLGG